MKEQIQKWVFNKVRATGKCRLGAKKCPYGGTFYCLLGFEAIFKNSLGFFASLGALNPLVFLRLLTETSKFNLRVELVIHLNSAVVLLPLLFTSLLQKWASLNSLFCFLSLCKSYAGNFLFFPTSQMIKYSL